MKRKQTRILPFDVADYLASEEAIAEYLSVSLEDPEPRIFLQAVRNVARAQGISRLAQATGLGRESLYKTLNSTTRPRFETILKLLAALGVSLQVHPRRREPRLR